MHSSRDTEARHYVSQDFRVSMLSKLEGAFAFKHLPRQIVAIPRAWQATLWLDALCSSCGMRGLFDGNRQRMYCVSGLSFRERDMLSDADTNLKISEIDAALKGAAPDAPVAFGTELFAALVRAGLIKDTLPAPLDDSATEVVHPSMYREKHPARVETHIANEAFAIGADIQAR